MTLSKNKGVVGLDLEAGSIAAIEVHENGASRVAGAGVLALPSGIVREGEVTDEDALAEAIKSLFSEHKLSKSVRLGVANQRVVVRTLRFPAIDNPGELDAAIRFEAQEHIPMPLDQAVFEYQVVGGSTDEAGEASVDVVVVAARRDMISSLVRAMRKAGLQPIGIDLSSFAMIRALASAGNGTAPAEVPSYEERMEASSEGGTPVPATLHCNLGDVMNLAVARGTTCLFTRVSQFGIEGVAQRLAERRGLSLAHARQWMAHVGLTDPVESIEGDAETIVGARELLGEGASKLVDELRLSLDYYGAQEDAVTVENIVACGTGTTIPGMLEHLERELGLPVAAPRPAALGHLDDASRARLTLPYGLAIEE